MTSLVTPTRRAFVAATAALVGLPSRVAAADADVVVVGAGAAGVAAAHRLRRAGKAVLVLEARGRVGGRVFTDTVGGEPFEAGAQFIHWAERNPWRRIAAELGVATPDESGGYGLIVFSDGKPVTESERSRRRRAFGGLDGLIAAATRPDRSVAQAAGPERYALAAATGLTRLTLGEEPDRVSAADYDGLWAGDDLVVPSGYGRLVQRHADGLPIRLATPVSAVDWSGAGVALETPSGTVRAKTAIVTVPLGVLQAENVRFTPRLPGATLDAIGGLGMGAYTKLALRMDRAKLDGVGLTDAIDLDEGTGGTTSFEFWPSDRPLVICYFGGDFARRLCERGEAAAIAHMGERLSSLFGARVGAAVTGGHLADWWTDPFSRGSYSIALPGRVGAREALREPIGRRVWLAGEASAGGGAMTAGGAYLDGERAADAVIRSLSQG